MSNNGMHPTADTNHFIYLQRLGAAGDAWRYALPTLNHRCSASVEPDLVTDPKILDVLNELMRREPIFHRPEFGTTRADFERMTETTFWEVGASGRRYSRRYVLDELERRYASRAKDDWQASDFYCLELAADNYLLTYTLTQGSRITRRSSIWRRTPEGWKIVYHQGTVVGGG